MWIDELLAGHPTRFREQLGVSHHVFQKLSQELQQEHHLSNSWHVSADELLAIFLYFAHTGPSCCMLQE